MQLFVIIANLSFDISFAEFPNYHPMVVHFPIVLLIVAVITQLLCLFRPVDSTLRWVTFYLLLGGTVGAFLAINIFDAHVSGDVSNEIFDAYETHHQFADLTFWAAVIASLVRLVANIWVKKKWMEVLLVLLVLVSGTLVAITGHHGAGLTYIHGVGPQGDKVLSK